MTKALVVYESRYGNTKIVAERIINGLRTAKDMQVDLRTTKDVDSDRIPLYDLILIGSPNHMGSPTRGIKKFIDKLGKLDLENKLAAAFDTYTSKDFEKAVKKIEKSLTEKVPGFRIVSPGLSIKVTGMKGPIDEEELPKCEEFGKKVASQIP